MPIVQDIPFHDIPHQTPLFLSYLDFSPAALSFYRHAPTREGMDHAVQDVRSGMQFPRKEIASILRRQNESYRCDAKTLGQIEELEQPDCVAVVTGQQVGLFTGPLYTIYKALTTVCISEELKKRGIRAVPIFWMETEDHDLAEVTCRTVLDPSSSIQNLDYRKTLFDETAMRSVGSLCFSESIRQVVGSFLSYLPDSIWKAEVQSDLESTYKPGATFAFAFAQLMTRIFRGSGLIFFDPQNVEAKRLSSVVFQKALREADTICAALRRRNQELVSAGFHAQVSVPEDSTVLFMIDDGLRRALEKRGRNFGLKNSDRTFSHEDLSRLVQQAPEKFSPSVLLRPLIQDNLFPTVVYVGGSSELAYFAQIDVIYRLLGRPMPVLWPRSSFTLLEPGIEAEMDRLGIEFRDFFREEPFLREKVLRRSDFSKGAASLDELREHLDQGLTEIRPVLQAIEPPLVQALENARRKILHNIQHLKAQVIRLEEKRNLSVSLAAVSLMNHCFPNRKLQERELCIHHFLVRHGPSLLPVIRSAIEICNFAHRVLSLE